MSKFEEWADQKFGSNFIEEEPITYFRMYAAFDAGQEEMKKQRDELLAASRSAILAIAAAAEKDALYQSDYEKLSAAIANATA